jgi:CheY-like chemotaxis protein
MTTGTTRKAKHVLLVEDDAAYRMVVLSMLRKAGFTSSFAVDGDNAIQKLEQEKFDLIIIDYLLPGPNGLEVIQWARDHEINIPALIITNYPSDELNLSDNLIGNTNILPKMAFTPADMLSIIQQMIEM